MDKINGYMLLVVAQKLTKATVWHYSTGNDEPVCPRKNPANSVGYISTADALTIKGVCYACAKFIGIHGDYQGYDESNGGRMFSITNPKPEPVAEAFCAEHMEFISQCADQHDHSDAGFYETNVWGTLVSDVSENFCGNCEREVPNHYDNCSSQRRASIQRIMDKVNASAGASTQAVEWHVFANKEWTSIPYIGYAPVNTYSNGEWHDVEYRHRAAECENSCTTWNGESIPSGWADGSHKPNSDFAAAMAWPENLYRGDSEESARRAVAEYLEKCAGYNHIIRAGESELYRLWARQIRSGELDHVQVHGRWYRVRQGVPVTQTYGKGL